MYRGWKSIKPYDPVEPSTPYPPKCTCWCQSRVYEPATFERGPGGIVASFKKLRQGDRLRVVAVEVSGKKWESYEMSAPSAQLTMNPQPVEKSQ